MSLIGQDVERWRSYYDEALKLRGIAASYQYPVSATSNAQGEPVADSYSDPQETHIFFDASPKIKTYKRLGWVVENDKNLPFLIHCSFHLPNLQKDCLFSFSGQYTGLSDRVFRVTELTTDIQAPDHVTCQVVPQYEKQAAGQTPVEIENKFNKSNYFLSVPTDYRGNYISEQPGEQ